MSDTNGAVPTVNATPIAETSYRPWNPPARAVSFSLKRAVPGTSAWEPCAFWFQGTKFVRIPTKIPLGAEPSAGFTPFTREMLLGLWGGGNYRCTFFGPKEEEPDKIGLVSGPIRFEIEHPDKWVGPAEARPAVDAPASEDDDGDEEEDDEEEDDEDEEAVAPPAPRAPPPLASPFYSAHPAARRKKKRRRDLVPPDELASDRLFKIMMFFDDRAERRAQAQIDRERAHYERQQREISDMHQRALTEQDQRHRRSLDHLRQLQAPNVDALERRLEELESEPEEEEDTPAQEDPIARAAGAFAQGIAKGVTEAALPQFGEWLKKRMPPGGAPPAGP